MYYNIYYTQGDSDSEKHMDCFSTCARTAQTVVKEFFAARPHLWFVRPVEITRIEKKVFKSIGKNTFEFSHFVEMDITGLKGAKKAAKRPYVV